jgi:tetratricopeptide (TPR) repeat protein
MKVVRVLAIVGLLLRPAAVLGQDAEWERLVSAGDEAMAQHQYSAADHSYQQALTLAEKHWKKDARISAAYFKLAESSNAQSKKEDAEVFANRSAAALEEALKAHKTKDASEQLRQADVSAALFDKVGDLFASHQKYPDAEVMYRKVISVREQYASEENPSKPGNEDFFRFMAQQLTNAQARVAEADDKLASLYRAEHKIPEALALYKTSVAVKERAYGIDRPQVAQSLNDLASCYSLLGEYDEAQPLYKRVIAILDRSDYKEGQQMATALENYALLLKKTGHEDHSQPYLERANAIRSKLNLVSH